MMNQYFILVADSQQLTAFMKLLQLKYVNYWTIKANFMI
jgi:hypothetical protein